MNKAFQNLLSLDQLNDLVEKERSILVYFSHGTCSVCTVLKPKVAQMAGENFPQIKLFYADTEKTPEIAGQHRVFTVPTILVFFEGKEYIRESRNIGVSDLEGKIGRLYNMLFD